VIKTGDGSVTGRMLGDGIYGSTVLDKAQQYVSDRGYGRQIGSKGYIFVINAALGEEYKDYRVEGLGRSHIRSPEWCVFTPNAQFKIIQAYEVKLIHESDANKFLTKYPANQNEDIRLRFKSFLKEASNMQEPLDHYKTFTFINGHIPTLDGEYVPFEEFEMTENVKLEPSAYGPSVVFHGTEESDAYVFSSPTDLKINHPDLYNEYIELLEKG